jgi:hypothetical protein
MPFFARCPDKGIAVEGDLKEEGESAVCHRP